MTTTPSTEKSLTSQIMGFGIVTAVLKLRSMVTLPILSRLIGTEGYGILSAIYAVVGLAINFIPLGVNVSMMVLLPNLREPEQRRKEFWNLVQIFAIFSLLITVVIFGYHRFFFGEMPKDFNLLYFLPVALLIPVGVVVQFFQSQIKIKQLAERYARITVWANLIEFAFLFPIVLLLGVFGVLCSTLLGQVLMMVWIYFLLRESEPFSPLDVRSARHLNKYIVYGFTLFVGGLANWIVNSSDRLLIKHFLTLSDLGVYQVAHSMCDQLRELSNPIQMAVLPIVINAFAAGNPQRGKYYLDLSYRLLLLLNLPLITLVSFCAPDILAVLSTKAFYEGARIVPWVAIGILFSLLSGPPCYALHAYKKPHLISVSVVASAIVNVVLNILWLPKYGIMASAVSTCIAFAVNLVLAGAFSLRYVKIGLSITWWLKVVLATAVFALATMGVRYFIDTPFLPVFLTDVPSAGPLAGLRRIIAVPFLRILFSAVIGFSLYFATLLATRVFTKEEWEKINQLLHLKEKIRQKISRFFPAAKT